MAESTLDLILRSKKSGTGIKDTEKDLGDLGKSTSKLGDMAKAAAIGGIGALAAGLSYAVDQAMEAERVTRATEQVIRSTGGAAGLTADEVGDLAAAMSELTGMDDEAIQSAENVLLTFTSVGKDVFPQATEAALDMSAALGQDLQGSITMIGKALQDPIQGVSALARVGVNFNESAKDTIKRMVEMNDVAGAQKFILKELNTEFGGMAKALGDTVEGKINKAKNALDNFAAAIGEKVLPVIGAAADAATLLITGGEKIREAYDAADLAIRKNSKTYAEYKSAIDGTAKAAGYLREYTTAYGDEIRKLDPSIQILTEDQWNVQRAFIETTGAIDMQSLAAQNAANIAATAAEADRMRAQSLNEMKAAAMQGKDALAQQLEAEQAQVAYLKTSEEAQATYRASLSETVTKIQSLAQSLRDQTDAQAKQMLAQANLDALKQAYDKGTISQGGFQRATDAVLLRYDLATPKSLAMAKAQDAVTKAFLDSDMPLNAFITSSEKIPGIASDGTVTLQELAELGVKPTTEAVQGQDKAVNTLKNSWAAIPREVKTTYTIETRGQAPSGGDSTPGRAGGGPVVERMAVNVDEIHREKLVPYQSGSMMPAGATIGSVTIPIYAQPGQSVTEIARAVAVELGRLANIGTLTGAGLIGA